MKKEPSTPLTDSYLESLKEMQPPVSDDFFYTRLRARMENETAQRGQLPVRAGWLIGVLVLLLGLNTWMLVQQRQETLQVEHFSSSLESVATGYDLETSSSY